MIGHPKPDRHRTRGRHATHGGISIEMILMLPVLALLILGVIEFGRYAQQRNSAQNAAEDGARFAVTHPHASDQEVRARALAAGGLGAGTEVTFTRTEVDGVTFVEVAVRRPFRFMIPLAAQMQTTIAGRVRRPAI